MRPAPVLRTKIAYGCAPSQFGHLYHARDLDRRDNTIRPVVLIHGGYWTTEFSLTVETAIARLLAERGALVFNVEYRRVGEPGGGWPTTGDDVLAALRALDGPVRKACPGGVADRVDWKSVAVVGHSAGGQLAVWAAAHVRGATERSTITTVVAQSAVLDMMRAAHRDSVRDLMGRPVEEIGDRYRAASPVDATPFAAHVVAVHAADDESIPVQMSRDYVRRVTAAGQSAELVVVDGEGHNAFVDPRSACTRHTLRALGL